MKGLDDKTEKCELAEIDNKIVLLVLINHWGTILSEDAFPMDESGSYYPEDWGYLGESKDLSKFQEETAGQLAARMEPQSSGGGMTMQP